MYNNIRIILVNTSHPGNIGAVARAMKAMELETLYLVKPKSFPCASATAMAAGADDVLVNAKVLPSLADALHGSTFVLGTSARIRSLSLSMLNPKEAGSTILAQSKRNTVSVVFGRESSGLTNDEMAMCNQHIHIPTNPDFTSLNLAAAVQLIAYEIKMASEMHTATNLDVPPLATRDEIQSFYEHLQQTLIDIKFFKKTNAHGLMAKLKRLFNRVQLEKREINILRGILTNINFLSKKCESND